MHWFYDPDLTPASSLLPESELKHTRSLRIEPGEQIAVTNGRGLVVNAEFAADGYRANSHEVFPPRLMRLHLVQALAKNDRDEQALQMAVELGVSSVTPWQAPRSIVRWDGKADKNQARWQAIAVEAMKQSQQPWLAKVEALASGLKLIPKGTGVVLDPTAKLTLPELDVSDELTLVVGPEGGIAEPDLVKLEAAGFVRVRLGRGVLRASTAGPAAIAALQALHGEFRK
jgi:16S rRNA (uracil1498-N3)-methyltransferase